MTSTAYWLQHLRKHVDVKAAGNAKVKSRNLFQQHHHSGGNIAVYSITTPTPTELATPRPQTLGKASAMRQRHVQQRQHPPSSTTRSASFRTNHDGTPTTNDDGGGGDDIPRRHQPPTTKKKATTRATIIQQQRPRAQRRQQHNVTNEPIVQDVNKLRARRGRCGASPRSHCCCSRCSQICVLRWAEPRPDAPARGAATTTGSTARHPPQA